jgi:hypothetical protein
MLTGKVEDKNIQGWFPVTYVNYHKIIHTLILKYADFEFRPLINI